MKFSGWLKAIGLLGVLDLEVKERIEWAMRKGEEKQIGSRILLRRVHNRGFAMNMCDENPKTVRFGSLAACGVCAGYSCFLFRKKGRHAQKTGMMLILAGALSNLYDRFVRGYVVDYIAFRTRFKKFSDVTFNIGDFFIFAGMGLAGIRRKSPQSDEK